jgi:NitT/TauT family transport system ATP-binding protein
MVAGLNQPTDGEIRIGDTRVKGPHPSVGVVFQEDATFPWMSNQKNVEFGLEFRQFPPDQWIPKARDALELVGLKGFERHRPSQLSGGMRQRLNFARVLAGLPDLVLMDEPFGSLDEQTRLKMGDEVQRIRVQTGATFILVTHSLAEAALLGDRVVVMSARPGRIAEVIENPLARPRTSSLMGSPKFADLTAHLWKVLVGESGGNGISR